MNAKPNIQMTSRFAEHVQTLSSVDALVLHVIRTLESFGISCAIYIDHGWGEFHARDPLTHREEDFMVSFHRSGKRIHDFEGQILLTALELHFRIIYRGIDDLVKGS